MKRIVTVIVGIVILAGAYFLVDYLMGLKDDNSVLAQKLQEKEKEVADAHEREQRLRTEKEEEIGVLRGAIDSANTVITGLLLRADEAEAQAAASKEESERLRQEVQPVIDANPQLKAYVNSLNLTIFNYENEIKALRFSLVKFQEKEQLYLQTIQNQMEIIESWKRDYEKLQGLATLYKDSFDKSQRNLKKEKNKKYLAFGLGLLGGLAGSAIG